MLTDVFALDLLVRDRINRRIAEANNDRLADSLANPAYIPTRLRHSTAHLLRGLAAGIDPCVQAEPGLLIATR